MDTYTIVLTLHIIAGFVALLAAFFACLNKQINLAHKWHIYSGRAFMIGFVIIFFTALILVILKPNIFLLLVAIFSFYLALSGLRLAKNKKGEPAFLDLLLHGGFTIIALIMLAFGIFSIVQPQNNLASARSIESIVFGAIGFYLATKELWSYKKKFAYKGKVRIAKHLSFMLGASISTVTAFVVTNFELQPAIILWLAPTVILVPYIIYWNIKLLKPKNS